MPIETLVRCAAAVELSKFRRKLKAGGYSFKSLTEIVLSRYKTVFIHDSTPTIKFKQYRNMAITQEKNPFS